MKTIFTLLTAVLVTVLLSGCADDDAFTLDGSASSGTNVPASRNFVTLFDDTNPAVITTNPIAGDPDLIDGGVTVQVTITAGDRLKLATVGATAYLDVDWGTLSATSCQIGVDGTCVITWSSNASLDDPFFPGSPNSPAAGDEFITFTTWILGEESFDDLNDNDVFDDGDVFNAANGADVPGPFLDLNHNGAYDLTIDRVLVPGNTNGVLTAA
ncbi:MAG TPA: hypothetical protein ENJ08_19055, partial [Gammaproteobacteria bacterium]|nr:hypothetical protein [Gammaproteobacteria bacterium]